MSWIIAEVLDVLDLWLHVCLLLKIVFACVTLVLNLQGFCND